MFHKEGYKIISITFISVAIVALVAEYYIAVIWLKLILQISAIIFLILILQFFRNPKRNPTEAAGKVIAPVDGKVVVIEEVYEKEYFKDNRIQLSIFMSPINVHVTRYPIGGTILFSKYHPGKYLAAWLPKASEENERTTIVIENTTYGKILYRQIAGALAKRIVNYAQEGMEVISGKDAGFIKFGSRVDVFLPLNANVNVTLGQKVKGGIDIIAS
ncbi:phosphatidylserine decarboxylase family protein [Leptobacterium sp. I13]|uniref:phosphatidylserine decarboxylase family protein n=1 Tax=Leptobacterium meishanense TaxID=3128904 RepID=UPI0030EBB5D4